MTLLPIFCDEEKGYRVNHNLQNFRYTAEIMQDPRFYEDFWRLIAHLLIRYELDDLYFEDTDKALDLLGEEFKNPKYPVAKNTAIVNDFEDDYNYIIAKIESIDEKDENQMLMF